jgi:hypothetical protein
MYVNAKMICVETVPGIGSGRIKQNCGGGEFKCDIFDTVVRNFVNATVYPHAAQQ